MDSKYAIAICCALLILTATCFLAVSTIISMSSQSLADHDALVAANAKLDVLQESYDRLLKTIGQQPPTPLRPTGNVGDK